MQESNWQELDFKIASDYTHGSPEYYRTLLRQMVGIPTLLPGEKNDISNKFKPTTANKVSGGGYMSSFLHKNER